MAYADGILSFFQYARTRMNVETSGGGPPINVNRKVKGHMMAQDWPPKNVDSEAFYLLVLGETPIGRQGYSATIPIVGHECQWVWIIKGDDIGSGQVGTNRGTRFMTQMQMKGEIVQALYPGSCEKLSWSYSGQPPTLVGAPKTPVEYIMWAPGSPREKLDKDSGVVYGMLSVRVWDMLDPILT